MTKRGALGGIYQRSSDGMWVAAIPLPNGDDGKRRRKVVVRARKADALAELKRLRESHGRAGGRMPTASPTLSKWLDLWWEDFGTVRLKVSTRANYRSKMDQYIRPAIGRIKLDRLGPEHVDRLREYVTKDKGLSSTTALGAHRVLSVILRDAHRRGLIHENPCNLTDAPKRAVYKVKYLDGAQGRALLASVDTGDGTVSQDLALWATALLTGVRQGERLGLTRDAINLDTDTITVSWQLQRLKFEHNCGAPVAGAYPCGRRKGGYCPQRTLDIPDTQEVVHVDGGLYLTRPKSEAGWREVPMVGPLRAVLERYLEDHEPGAKGLVFTRDGGRPIDPSRDSEAWASALEAARLPRVTGHSARHTANTILTELGITVDVRQKILGHASRAVNEGIYTHASDARVAEAMTALGKALDWRQSSSSG